MGWKKGDYEQLEHAKEMTKASKSLPWWQRYGQPVLDAAADFVAGFTLQIVQNNLDALAMIAPMPPDVRQNYYNSWENVHSGRSVWYQAGRVVGSLAGVVQGVWEMSSGVATATGGTVVSCGTVVLCFAGGGAAVVAGGAVALHGAVVTVASVVNVVEGTRALIAAVGGRTDPTLRYGTNKGTTRGNSRLLRKNLEQAGEQAPPNYEAHHIVPSTSRREWAVRARQILWERFGIDINAAENGVFVPKFGKRSFEQPAL